MVSTSTRNFPNRLGNGANVYLASAELAAVAARCSAACRRRRSTWSTRSRSTPWASEIYRYLNFDEIASFQKAAEEGKRIGAVEITEVVMA